MEIRETFTKGIAAIKKYKYAALVLVIGLLLMAIPGNKDKNTVPVSTADPQTETAIDEQLEELLAQIDGAGEVQVMLTELTGERTVYQTNDDDSSSKESSSSNKEAVIITDSQRNQVGLVKQIIPPTYQGAVIVCEGADDPTVRLAIVNAVSNLTGLGANQISVLKMK